jgi:hypothetical protein
MVGAPATSPPPLPKSVPHPIIHFVHTTAALTYF